MSLNTGYIVSRMGWSMMSILVGSWDDGVDRSVTINTSVSSDGDWELTNCISVSISSRNRGRTSMTVWSLIGGNGGY